MILPDGIRILERGWLSSNNILFTSRAAGRPQNALIDSGYATHAPQTLALVRHALQGRALDSLINTHLHSDHCGGNAALQRAYAPHTAIPAADAEAVRNWDEDALHFRASGQQCERFGFDATIRPGDRLVLADIEWQALAAPGHDPHALLFYCPSARILITGDALWRNGFGVIFPEIAGQAGFAETQATLKTIAGLNVDLVIPGHGAPFTDVRAALDIAFSRIAWLAADPRRNAENAVKVLLKFLLLERKRLALAQLPSLLAGIPMFCVANRRYFQLSDKALADWIVTRLIRAGAAKIEDDTLCDVG
jgi:glyoxylase-like metal-dependent hydrolase (beta-lactamase superfamily II)